MSSFLSVLGRSVLRPMAGALRFNKLTLGTSYPKNTPLSPKRGNREYYKGNGCRSAGRHTAHVLSEKSLVLDVPDLTGFKLKPYVAYSTPKVK
ncbi:39S ribosomal protein L41 [Blastocystis sp. subtype 4]|uniref:39S ribosomal protein L41 n=1 Tax=Blastocystis sp. subtype 4 TaxID=944170 RepID=UPI000711D791|nr:39S ribosomal protein L41 [Blastocystis sp. subtype 4]KNB46064.1 39S ribosomal protein L41 [Blastocystis sp. subtype 4]|eukprot:XP_014529517.1 39S ribosomal protein L41 [Blastocystis sp. subtype 4]